MHLLTSSIICLQKPRMPYISRRREYSIIKIFFERKIRNNFSLLTLGEQEIHEEMTTCGDS